MSYPQGSPPQNEGGPGYPYAAGYPPVAGYPGGPIPTQAGGFPPPQAGYLQPAGYPPQPGYLPNQTTGVITHPLIGPGDGSTERYTQSPALIVCQHCKATVTTCTEYKTGLLTWAICGCLCIIGCFLGCCLIPFCFNGTKDVKHSCPNCKNVVGRFRHF